MGDITLKKIDESNFVDAFHLKLGEGQEKYVSNPIRSLAQVYVYYHQCTPFGTSDKVILTCNKENTGALHLYHRLGFQETGNTDEDEIELALMLS